MDQENIITIDFKALSKVLWREKLLIIAITLLFTIGGTWYAFTAREEFFSEGKILPEVTSGGNSSLGGLANMIGIGGFEMGLKNSTDAIRPDLYPDILKNTPFFINLLQKKVTEKDGTKIRFDSFYNKYVENEKVFNKQNLAIPKGNPEGVVIINRLTEERIKDLKERITSSIDKKTGVINISVKLPDPVVAAEVAKFSIDYMTKYITDYRTGKLKNEVDFLSEKVASSKGKYYSTQERKAKYTDLFQASTIKLQTADVRRERIDSEYKISSNVYNELLVKLEEAKLKLHQETPIFQIAQAPVVPNLKSEPKKAFIILFSFFLGFTFSILIIYLRFFFK